MADDQPLVRSMLTDFLTGDGHTVESAGDGREALEKFNAGTFDVVISDRGMPGINGAQLAAAIRRNAPDVRFIMVTGFAEMMEMSNESLPGVDHVAGKPITLQALRDALSTVTHKSRDRNRRRRDLKGGRSR